MDIVTAGERTSTPKRLRSGRLIRHRAMTELVASNEITSQQMLVDLLAAHGFSVTQATVSRDMTELGVGKAVRGERHVYVVPDTPTSEPRATDERLRRLLSELPVTIRRSGLILLLISGPGSAPSVAEAIDRSTLNEQEGTLAGDNTVLLLFRDEEHLERGQARLAEMQAVR